MFVSILSIAFTITCGQVEIVQKLCNIALRPQKKKKTVLRV